MNVAERTEEMIRSLVSTASEHGFAVTWKSPDIWELLSGDVSIGATNWRTHAIELQQFLRDDRPFLVQVLAHEVGHLVLGHGDPVAGRAIGDPVVSETEADQWAVNVLKQAHLPYDQVQEHEQNSHDPDNPSAQFYAAQRDIMAERGLL